MKRNILTIAALALLAIPTINAEDKPRGDKPDGERRAPGGPGGPGGRGGDFGPEERLKRMTEALGLTPDQAEKIKAIMVKGAEAMKALRPKDGEKPSEDNRAKYMEIFKTQREEIAAVLTPEQKEKMEKLRTTGPGGPGERGEGRPGGKRPGGPGGPGEKPADK